MILAADLCLNYNYASAGAECSGPVEYRLPLSGSGRSFPRCEKHWDERLDVEQGWRQRYPEQPPAGWSEDLAGEAWGENDY